MCTPEFLHSVFCFYLPQISNFYVMFFVLEFDYLVRIWEIFYKFCYPNFYDEKSQKGLSCKNSCTSLYSRILTALFFMLSVSNLEPLSLRRAKIAKGEDFRVCGTVEFSLFFITSLTEIKRGIWGKVAVTKFDTIDIFLLI